MKTEILAILLCHLVGKSVSIFFLNFPQIVIVIKQKKTKNKTHADVKVAENHLSLFFLLFHNL